MGEIKPAPQGSWLHLKKKRGSYEKKKEGDQNSEGKSLCEQVLSGKGKGKKKRGEEILSEVNIPRGMKKKGKEEKSLH